MARAQTHFETFVRRVHRRHVVLRAIERMGLGILAGCAAALPLLALVLWRGLPALQLVSVALIGGALAGLLWGLIARPTPLAAAMEADRQLGWADLLSSALAVRTRAQDDPWAAAVTADADARCRLASASTVVLNRLGARAWGGIGLATALVLVLGLLPTYAVPTRAENQVAAPNSLAKLEPIEGQPRGSSQAFTRRIIPQGEPEDSGASRMSVPDGNGPQEQGDNATPPSSADHPRDTAATDPNGHGVGSSHSRMPDPNTLAAQNGTHARSDSVGGRPSGGVGESAAQFRSGAGASGSTRVGLPGSSVQTPPWQSSDWPQDARQARQAVERGEIPDAYLDLVRGYFDRP